MLINTLIRYYNWTLFVQVRIHNFLEKMKKNQKRETAAESQEDLSKEALIMRKRVKSLIKRNRIIEVHKIVRSEEPKSWGRDTQAKVMAALIILANSQRTY